MKVLLPIICVFIAGCVCLNPNHKQFNAPSVSTELVIKDLKDTKEELVKAGEANTQVGKSVDKALTLAEKLDLILEEIENNNNKNIIEPKK